tara:strand:+ start:733 stop:1236 length:504 start_codon:yes stop_codon:yes gene_type:complete
MQKENSEDLTNEVDTITYWQWIKGDNNGNIVTIKDTDDKWINFNEGSRLAKDLRDEFLQPLDTDIANEFMPTDISVIPPAVDVTTTPTPIRVLFDKQKKNNKIKLILEFPVNIPPEGIYELMSSSFGGDEVKEELKSFIKDQISEDLILNGLFDSIESLIESKYNGE